MAEMVRVNARVSASANAWLDKYSEESGVPKSTLIYLAIESYREQKEAFEKISDMHKLMEKLEEIEKKIK